MTPALKRALWCRWFHRWHMPRRPESVTSLDPDGSGAALVLTGGPHRNCCDACEDAAPRSRAYDRWCAS